MQPRTQRKQVAVRFGALRARVQVARDRMTPGAVGFAVGVRRQNRCGFVAVHDLAPRRSSPIARSSGERCSRALARASLDITVPIGMSAMRAISLYDSS